MRLYIERIVLSIGLWSNTKVIGTLSETIRLIPKRRVGEQVLSCSLGVGYVSATRWLTVEEICRLGGTFEGDREFYRKILPSLILLPEAMLPVRFARLAEFAHWIESRVSILW
jgi:hypothetical protein